MWSLSTSAWRWSALCIAIVFLVFLSIVLNSPIFAYRRYGFCKSNALYSASLLFRMFIFLLTPLDTWDILLVFQIKSQPGVPYKSVAYKKRHYNVVFKSSKNENITLPHEFIFVFIQYFNGAILPGKSCQKRGVRKLWTYFTPCSSVSIVNFEQVNANWVSICIFLPFQYFYEFII